VAFDHGFDLVPVGAAEIATDDDAAVVCALHSP
jgi:hypothetical protein